MISLGELTLVAQVSSSRLVEKMTITKANQLRLETNWDSIEKVVDSMFVATAENEPQ